MSRDDTRGVAPHGRSAFPIEGETRLAKAEAPEFRFSRMGPAGPRRCRRRCARRWPRRWSGRRASTARSRPATRTSASSSTTTSPWTRRMVMLGDQVSPAALLQGSVAHARPRLAVRRRPHRPGLAGVLRRRPAPGHRQDRAHRTGQGAGRLRPRAGRHEGEGPQPPPGADPRPPQRREPRGRADPPGDDPLPQPGRRHARRRRTGRRPVHPRATPGDAALPVDDPHRLPQAHLRPGRGRRRLHPRPQGLRGRGRAR